MKLDWVYKGDLDVTATGRLALLNIPAEPGVYRLRSENNCYVGQARNLRNRIYEYCRPTQHLEHEHRLHWLLRDKPCKVEVIVSAETTDLTYRRSLERLGIQQSREKDLFLWNLSQHSKPDQYQMLIDYHQAMIQKYKALLAGQLA